MRTVNPIELNLDELAPESPAAAIVKNHLRRPIEEINAIALLLGMARKLPDHKRFGTDIDFLDEIMLRRIRSLAEDCQSAVDAIVCNDCDMEFVANLKNGFQFED